jgi:hypothetical protein
VAAVDIVVVTVAGVAVVSVGVGFSALVHNSSLICRNLFN